MALGNSRPHNGGRDWQLGFLALELAKHQLAYKVTGTPRAERKLLWLTGHNAQVTLPFVQSYCYLEHVRSGRWVAVSEWDGRAMASGCSVRSASSVCRGLPLRTWSSISVTSSIGTPRLPCSVSRPFSKM